MKAIQTSYAGIRFKSRLEAKWAVYFDRIKLKWIYEHEGFPTPLGWYLPDFYFPELEVYAEVKPTKFTEEQKEKCRHLGSDCLLLDGVPARKNYELIRANWCELRQSSSKGRVWFEFQEEDLCEGVDPSDVEYANNYKFTC